MKQILLILSMLISHTLIYGSAALRPAIQIGANNLFNTINSSNFTSSQIDNSSQITNIPTISNYLYQPIQVPKFDSKIIPFTPFKNQQQPIPLPSDLLKMPTNLIKSVTTEQSNSNIASSQNVNAKQQSKKAPTNTHIETLLFGFNQLDGFPSETERMIFFDMLNLKNRNKDENYIKNLTDATKYYSYKDLYNLEKEAKQLRADCGLPLDKLDCAEIESTILNTKIPASQRTEKENYKEWYSPSKSVKIEFLTNFFQNQHEIMNNIDLIIRLMPENISLGQLATMIIYAEHLADDKPLTMKHVREAILTIKDGPKGSMRDPLQKDVHIYKINEYNRPEVLTIHYEKGKLKSTALHEASHAFAQIEAYLPQFVSTLTIEPRSDAHGYISNNNSYEHITIYNFTNTQFLQTIIMTLAGTIGEQIFDTYRYQGYSDAMLTDKNEIFTFLSSRIGASEGDGSDFEQAKLIAKIIAENQGIPQKDIEEKIKEIIADCYIKTYKLINRNKDIIENLANAAMKKGTLYEDEIYDIVGIARPLHNFEQGPMTEKEMMLLGQYRFPETAKIELPNNSLDIAPQNNGSQTIKSKIIQPNKSSQQASQIDATPNAIKHEYGYNSQGEYIGQAGSRDKNGKFEEII